VVTLSGIELTERDPSIHPGDDLYLHMNHRWLERSAIPDDKARYGAFTVLAEEAEKAVRTIIEQAATAPEGSEARKVGDLYTSFMDEKRIEEVGLAPLRALFEKIHSATTKEQLLTVMAASERLGVDGLWQLFVDNDPGNPERYIVFLEQGGISLPDESYYRSGEHADTVAAFVTHVEKVFALVGLEGATDRAQRVVAFETALAANHWDNVASRDAEATYNLWPEKQLSTTLGSFSFDQWRSGIGISETAMAEVVVRQPSFIEALGELWSTSDLDTLRDWVTWHSVMAYAP
jgi:putative endopeptidase